MSGGELGGRSQRHRVAQDIEKARAIMAGYPEVEVLVPAIGRPDDGTDPTGYYRVEIFAPLKPMKEWPRVVDVEGWRRYLYGNPRFAVAFARQYAGRLALSAGRRLPGRR